jgi:hypothetical protein
MICDLGVQENADRVAKSSLLLGVAAAVLRFLRQCGAPRSIERNAVHAMGNFDNAHEFVRP